VIALVMVMVPKPPGSRQLISPAVAVFEIAPAKVLQGAVRLQGLTSSPTPETQVRVAWALAGADASNGVKNPAAIASKAIRRMIYLLVCLLRLSQPQKITTAGSDSAGMAAAATLCQMNALKISARYPDRAIVVCYFTRFTTEPPKQQIT
jgi:hypothetical protein